MNITLPGKPLNTSLPLQSAYLLVSHGSRDPRPQTAVEHLSLLLCQKLRTRGVSWVSASTRSRSVAASPVILEPLVGTASLELAPLPLHEQIRLFGKRAQAAGYKRLQVLPLFLLPGVHVKEDIPAEVQIAQQALSSKLMIEVRPHLGTHTRLGRLLANQLRYIKADARILLSHGSRRPGGNQSVEVVATQLEAVPAYWSVQPSLESQIRELVKAGYEHIGILPYFLFPGEITDAIAQAVAQHRLQFPSATLYLAEPIGASAELADLILDLMDK